MLFAAFALILALVPGPLAYAGSKDASMDTVFCAHLDLDACAQTMTAQTKAGKHGVGSCDTVSCCLGAVCVVAGLPPTTAITMPMSVTERTLPRQSVWLTGRNVAPPLDPPRSFA